MKKTKIKTRHVHERYFFDIPVFRCDFDTWVVDQDKKKTKLAQHLAGENKVITSKEIEFAETCLRSEWSAYYYSEMVGMIRLFAINTQIRAELWFVKERVSKNLKRKKWHLANIKVFEFWIHASYKNEDVFQWILNRLEKENKEWILKNRHIDIEAFQNTGKFIDYVGLADFTK